MEDAGPQSILIEKVLMIKGKQLTAIFSRAFCSVRGGNAQFRRDPARGAAAI